MGNVHVAYFGYLNLDGVGLRKDNKRICVYNPKRNSNMTPFINKFSHICISKNNKTNIQINLTNSKIDRVCI